MGRRRLPGRARGDHLDRRRRTTTLPCDHLTAALRRAARAGGDTDTVAAIAGVAARRPLGRDRRPAAPGAAASTAGAPTASHRSTPPTSTRWPASPSGGGQPDGSGWPGVAHLDYGPMPARCVELDGAWFGNVAGIADAVDGGATVVISLCRMGTDDVPAGVEHHTVGLIDTTAPTTRTSPSSSSTPPGPSASSPPPASRCSSTASAPSTAPRSIAAAYLIVRGVDADTAIARASAALGRCAVSRSCATR